MCFSNIYCPGQQRNNQLGHGWTEVRDLHQDAFEHG